MLRKLAVAVVCNLVVLFFATLTLMGQETQVHPDVFNEVAHATSPHLKSFKSEMFHGTNGRNIVPMHPITPHEVRQAGPDPVLQTSVGPLVGTTNGLGFDGVTANGWAPPDTNGAVGATQYVQWVNVEFAVYNKSTGALEAGPFAGSQLWASVGG